MSYFFAISVWWFTWFVANKLSFWIFKYLHLHRSKVKLVNKGITRIDEFFFAFLQRICSISLWWRHFVTANHPAKSVKVTPCTLFPTLPPLFPHISVQPPGSKHQSNDLLKSEEEKFFGRWSKQQRWQVSSFSELKLFKSARPCTTAINRSR